jgi:hypothetical protein
MAREVLLTIDAATKMPLAVNVAKVQEHEALWTRALVTKAWANLGEYGRLHKLIFNEGHWAGTTPWWLDQHGLRCVGPASTPMTVTADARAQAAAEEESTVDRRVHTVRHRRRQAAIGRIDPAMGTDLQQVKNLDMV